MEQNLGNNRGSSIGGNIGDIAGIGIDTSSISSNIDLFAQLIGGTIGNAYSLIDTIEKSCDGYTDFKQLIGRINIINSINMGNGDIASLINLIWFLNAVLNLRSDMSWEQRFYSELNELFSKKADEATTMECSSCTLAAKIAVAIYTTTLQPHHPTFLRNLYECVEGLLLQPFTFTLQRDGTGYKAINIRPKNYHVVKAEPKCGDVITEKHNHFSRFCEEIREILKLYLEGSSFHNPVSFEEALDACIQEYAVYE